MARGPTPDPERRDALATRIGEILAEGDLREAAVVLPFAVSPESVAGLLADARVASVLASGPAPVAAFRETGRTGWIASDGSAWELPARTGRNLFVVGDEGLLGFRLVRELRRAGVRKVVYLGPVDEPVAAAIDPFLLRRARRGAWRRVASHLLRSGRPEVGAHLERRYGRAFHALRTRYFPRPLLEPGETVPGRVVLATGSLSPGGAERQVVNTLRGLHEAGEKDVSLVCEYLQPPYHDFHLWRLRELGIPAAERARPPWRRIPSALRGRLQDALAAFDADMAWVGQRILGYVVDLLERRPAVVHTWLDEPNVTVGIAALLVGVPRVVLSCRAAAPVHFELYQPFMRPGYHALLDETGVVMLNNSAAGAESYAEWLGIAPERIRVLHNGIELPRRSDLRASDVAVLRRRLGVAPGQRMVGGVARFTEEKQPLLWVETAAEVARRLADVRFVMIGEGPMQREIERRAAELGIADRLVLTGFKRDPRTAMAAMDVLLMTSRLEGLPNVLLEAQGLGTPVVTTLAGGSGEAVDDGRTGRVVAAHAPGPLADAVQQALEDRAWAERVRTLGPAFVERRFGIDRMVRETLAVYREPAR